MTVSTTDSVVEYVSGGPAFPVPYRFLQDSDIEAVLVKQDGTTETLTGAQYTLSGAGSQNGGTLTSSYAAGFLGVSGASLTISRIMDPVQPTDLRNQGKFLAETHETVFDRLTMLIQQGFSGLSRALKRPPGKSYFDAEGRLISNVADPVSIQDAATMGWASRYFGDLIDGATGLINTTTGILYDSGTLFDHLRFGVARTVDSIAALRLLSSARNQRAFVLGYYAKGDLGGGAYYVDQADTTSADNGGTIIVAADGARWKLSNNTSVNAHQFGAKGDGATDDRAAIQAAINYAATAGLSVHFSAKVYKVGQAPGKTYCLLNPGVSMIGERAIKTTIAPMPTLGNSIDFIMVQPPGGGAVLDWMEMRNFIIYPGFDGTKRGRRAIVVDMDAVSNSSSLLWDGVYCAPGNDLSLVWVTNGTNNPQGGPANSIFQRCHFWEGAQLVNHGDSISFFRCVFRSSAASGRTGLEVEGVSLSGGQPAQLDVNACNFDCDGGAFHAKNSLSGKFCNNNVEQSHGTGSSSGAIIDIDGNANQVGYMEISGNNVGIFGTASVGQAIRVNNAIGTKLKNNRLLCAGPSFGLRPLLITASATDTALEGNEFDTGFAGPTIDSGVGTRGLPRLITPLNGFGNLAGDQALVVHKDLDGAIWVAGSMTCPASPSGQLFGSLPAGFRPSAMQRIPVSVIAAGVYTSGVITVATNGDLIFYASIASPTQFFFNARFGGTGFEVGSI